MIITPAKTDAMVLLKRLLEEMTRYAEIRAKMPPYDVHGQGFDACLDTPDRRAMACFILNRAGGYDSEWTTLLKEAIKSLTQDRKVLQNLSGELWAMGEADLSRDVDLLIGDMA